MKKKVAKTESMVYRPTKLFSQIDKALMAEVTAKKHRTFNSAVNHHLQKSLKLKIPTYLTLANLSVNDKFRFANNNAYKIYLVKEDCKRLKKHNGVVRRCEIIESAKIVYPRCTREVIKIE